MNNHYQGFSKQVQLTLPFFHSRLDWTDVSGASNGGYVDVTVIEELLYIIRTSQDKHVLGILVGQDGELSDFPGVLDLCVNIK